MPQLYVLRRFSSWSFRLSVSMALGLSSAGLAAGLLVGTPLGDASLPHPMWKPSPALAQVTSSFSSEQRAASSGLPLSLSGLVPAYSLTPGTGYSAPPATLASYFPTSQTASSDSVSSPADATLKATVQRSWRTFKLAFR